MSFYAHCRRSIQLYIHLTLPRALCCVDSRIQPIQCIQLYSYTALYTIQPIQHPSGLCIGAVLSRRTQGERSGARTADTPGHAPCDSTGTDGHVSLYTWRPWAPGLTHTHVHVHVRRMFVTAGFLLCVSVWKVEFVDHVACVEATAL